MESLYLDHAATTPLRPEVREIVASFLDEAYGNPSSAHARGRRAAAALEEARERAASALGAEPSETFFVRGGTESDNLAVIGSALAARDQGRIPLLLHSAFEHRAVLDAATAAAGLTGGGALALAVGADGALDLGALDEALAADAAPTLVSVMWANNEVGTLLPVREVVRRARGRGVPVHSDAVQAVGKVPVRLDGDDAPDLLTVTGHKIGGPRGTGMLFARRRAALSPLLHGGGQERGLRPGTEDLAGAWGMALALELAVREQESEGVRLTALRDRMEARLLSEVDGLVVHGAAGPRAPHVSHLGVTGVDSAMLIAALDLEGVCASSGSACASGALRASHVLRAMYGEAAEARAHLRLSLGRTTRADEVERAADVVAAVVGRLRARTRASAGARA